MKINTRLLMAILFTLIAANLTRCSDFVEVSPPRTALVKSTVFGSNQTADAAMTGIYYQLQTSVFASGGILSVSFLTTLMSDEQENYSNSGTASSLEFQQFNDNAVIPNNSLVMSLWSDLYNTVYRCNAMIEGLESSSMVTPEIKKQLEGEAKFIRAFSYFYLVNLWGDVPKVTTTNYAINSKLGRSPQQDIYAIIVEDLNEAINLLPEDYTIYSEERVRATKWAAQSLLARVHLYNNNWMEARDAASIVINNTTLFQTTDLNDVFRTNNSEAILQLWSIVRPNEFDTFRFFDVPSFGAIREAFATGFESGDLRASTWIDTTESGFYRAVKYFEPSIDPATQYSTVLRLSELYLIRAESSTRLGELALAKSDIDVVRERAGLSPTTSNDQESLLAEILEQRKSEFFTEWGHRWFDLKRSGKSDQVLSPLKSEWQSSALLLPVPENEIRNNPALLPQNPGY